jgi:hypothetical protein
MSRLLAVTAVAAAVGTSWAGAASAAPAAATSDPNLFASVSATGTLVAGSAGTSVTSSSTGQYQVTFGQNVSGCAYTATTVNTSSQALMTWVATGGSAQQVSVETQEQDGGGPVDAPFSLVVDCGQPGWSFAVVGYTENLVRSTAGTTLDSVGAGRYDVTFPASVKGCAYLASSGDPGTTSSDSTTPNSVSTGTSSNSHQVYIETKNAGGGLSPGLPFHLEVICPAAADTSFAAVQASGLPAHASKLTSAYNSATGQYAMVTGADLAACAEVATRGSTNTSVPYTPATVQTVPGPASNTIGVQVRDLLYFGGNPDDQSFYAAAVC